MKNILVFIVIMVMSSCAKLELEEIVDSPVPEKADPISNVTTRSDGHDWQVFSLYFLDKNTKERLAKFRKVWNEPRWYYQAVDSIDDYKVLFDIADPYIMGSSYELGELKSSFIYGGDNIRIHRCGDYPKENPRYSLLVVTVKEGKDE